MIFKHVNYCTFQVLEDDSYGEPGNNFHVNSQIKGRLYLDCLKWKPRIIQINLQRVQGKSVLCAVYKSIFIVAKYLLEIIMKCFTRTARDYSGLANLNLHSINIQTGEIKSYNLDGKLGFSGISSILEDDHFNLWLGTEIGSIPV